MPLPTWLPALTLGLFAGRVASERLKLPLWLGALLTLGFCAGAVWLWQRELWGRGAPLLWLWLYLPYPDQSPKLALAAAGCAFVALFLHYFAPRLRFSPQIMAAGIFLAFAGLYIATLSPNIMPADNGEFQLAAAKWGVAHPPGFPLYTILAATFAHLPLPGETIFRINLFAALTSAAALTVLYAAVWQKTRRHLAGILAAVALGGSSAFWTQARFANIRGMTTLFAGLSLLAFCWLLARPEKPGKPLFGLILSLSLGVFHHPSLAFMGAIWGAIGLWAGRNWLKRPRNWGWLLLAGILGFALTLYLPLRGAAGAWGAPANLASWNGFWNHLLARGFAGDFFYFTKPALFGQRLLVMGNILSLQFNGWLLAGAALGGLSLLRKNRLLAIGTGLGFAVHLAVTAIYRAPQSIEYMMPAYLILAFWLGSAVTLNWSLFDFKLAKILAPILLIAGIFQAASNAQNFLHYQNDTSQISRDWLENAPPDAVILANWHWATPLWAWQQIEGLRPDVQVEYVPPSGIPYAESWAQTISQALATDRDVIATNHYREAYGELPAFEPFGEALLFRQTPRQAMPAGFVPLEIELPDGGRLLGYDPLPATAALTDELIITVAWQPKTTEPTPIFAHLVDETGKLAGQFDTTITLPEAGVALMRLPVTPTFGSQPGLYQLLIGIGQNPRMPLATIKLTSANQPMFSQNPLYRPVPSGGAELTLIGYDWDKTLSDQLPRLYLHWRVDNGYRTELFSSESYPDLSGFRCFRAWNALLPCPIPEPKEAHYIPFGQGIVWTGFGWRGNGAIVPGTQWTLPLTFGSSKPLFRDYVVSARLVGYEADDFHWAWWDLIDGVPALGGIPTLKWMIGSQIYDPHRFNAPSAAQPGGDAEVLLMLYDAFSEERLPVLDDRIETIWAPLGKRIIEK